MMIPTELGFYCQIKSLHAFINRDSAALKSPRLHKNYDNKWLIFLTETTESQRNIFFFPFEGERKAWTIARALKV